MKNLSIYPLIIYVIYFISITDILAQKSTSKITKKESILVDYSKVIEELKMDNKILKEKIDVLNSTNDKILNSVYWTIGAILTSVFGLTVWNAIKNRKLDEEKFKMVLENSKKDLLDGLNLKLKDSIAKASFSELIGVKSEINSTKHELHRFITFYIKNELIFHPMNGYGLERDLFDYYYDFVVSNKLKSEYKYLLEAIVAFHKGKNYVSIEHKTKILEFINQECKDDMYKLYVDEVKKNLELSS